jgi:hypothetical protein
MLILEQINSCGPFDRFRQSNEAAAMVLPEAAGPCNIDPIWTSENMDSIVLINLT